MKIYMGGLSAYSLKIDELLEEFGRELKECFFPINSVLFSDFEKKPKKYKAVNQMFCKKPHNKKVMGRN